MNYQAAIDQLSAMAPELHSRPGQPRRKFSLDEVGILVAALGHPQRNFPSVLIAGTNGKGSTASTLAAILSSASLRTGLYTSPHLSRPNERIRIDGLEISDEAFARQFFRVRHTGIELQMKGELQQLPSYFETLTAMAFLHFAEAGVNIAVLEVGMGGRLDATNIVDPLISVITDISLDHTEWLGPTIADIAREKAGILRQGGTLVTLPQHPEANRVIGEAAVHLDVIGVPATPYMPNLNAAPGEPFAVEALGVPVEIASPLHGAHQHRNVALAIATAVELAVSHGFPITAPAISDGVRRTDWPARFERLKAFDREWILDVAHNPAGAWALRAGLSASAERDRLGVLIFSCLKDKPAAEMAQILFPMFREVILAPIHSARATPVADLLEAAAATQTRATVAESVARALELAVEGSATEAIVVSGSVYLVGDVRAALIASRTRESSIPERVGQQP